MQGYTYSVFSILAIVIHLTINFGLLFSRRGDSVHVAEYRGFLASVLAYYVVDAAWGVLAGLGWTGPLYVDTILYFLSLAVFVLMWCRFAVSYLALSKWTSRILTWCGYAILAVNVVLLTVNCFNDCFFYINEQGTYLTGVARTPAISLLVAYDVLIAALVFVKALGHRGFARRRCMMVSLFCITIAVVIVLQVIWPLTPFTALGCLFSNCFFHVFVVQDEQSVKHAAELENALARARAAEKSRSMFFSIVSHDIRTPLNAILGYSELLQSGVEDPKEREEALNSIRASGTTLLQLVNDVLDLAKMDAGKMTLRPEPVRLAKLTDDVFASFKMNANAKGIELLNRTADVPMIILDGHRFRQILFNLIGNAVKFTTRGSVTVAASYTNRNLEVSVTDTGCGIASDMLKHVLDPFVQVQDPSHAADRAGGTGLGLSICRSLVEVMGGELVVESELGKGSTFKIHIPGVVTSTASAESTVESKPAVALKSLPKNVLVVDDSPVNRAVLTALLKKAGITSVHHAYDGGEALAELESAMKAGYPHDLVFSDFWMPNMSGLEFIEKLRADSRFSGLPVFAVTADMEFHDDARSSLFNGILLKPLTYGKLVDVLAQFSK